MVSMCLMNYHVMVTVITVSLKYFLKIKNIITQCLKIQSIIATTLHGIYYYYSILCVGDLLK